MGHSKMRLNGTALRLVAMVPLIAMTMGPLPAAGRLDQLEEPGRTDRQPGFHVTTLPTDVMALGIGVPKRVAMIGAWVVLQSAEGPPDVYPTRAFWWDDEELAVYFAYYKSEPESELSYSITIKDSRGIQFFSWETPTLPGNSAGLEGLTVFVGDLPAGSYKVTVKVSESDRSVGQQFWLFVRHRES